MLLIPVGWADCSIHFRRPLDNEDMVITFGVEVPPTALPGDVASKVAIAWGTEWNASTTPGEIMVTRATARVAVEGDAPRVEEAAINITGSGTSEFAPQNCAILVRKITTHGGRRGRGRIYLPWVVEADVSDVGALTSTAMAFINTHMNGFLTKLDTADVPMALLHSEGASSTPVPYPVVSLACDPVIATQRQRLRR